MICIGERDSDRAYEHHPDAIPIMRVGRRSGWHPEDIVDHCTIGSSRLETFGAADGGRPRNTDSDPHYCLTRITVPREFELPGKAALITKDGDRLILKPVAKRNFIAALRALGALPPGDRFPAIEDPTPEPINP